ncbi:MAG: hypothetical protein AB8G05_08435 [Oligoflexales bacterium]
MDSNSTEKMSPKTTTSNTIPIRVSKTTARLLKSIVSKCNRKSHGRRVKQDNVILKALQLICEPQIKEIKEATFSSQDHLEIQFKKYCQQSGTISKDEFLKMLLAKGLPQVNQIKEQANPKESN